MKRLRRSSIPAAVLIVYLTINVPVRGMHHHGPGEENHHVTASGWVALADPDDHADHCGCLVCGFMHLAQQAPAIIWAIGPVDKAPESLLIEPICASDLRPDSVHSPRGPPLA
jgi:hypothetical protein